MTVSLAQPDVTLLLDMGGMIREASVSSLLAGESVEAWLGQHWGSTVPDLAGDKVRRIVDDARDSGISAFRQVTQRFPSGREVPMEYTTVLLGGRAGMLAVGKSLLAVAELQSRFIAAQQSLERDSWKLREVETRYRLLFNHSSEAVMLVRASNLRVVEANPAALRALGADDLAIGSGGLEWISAVAPADRPLVRSMIQRVQEQGKTPGIVIHLGAERDAWMVRASAAKGEPSPLMMLQLTSSAARLAPPTPLVPDGATLDSLPDGFVVIDADGVIQRANVAFAEMVDMGAAASVLGERLDRWIWRPGADVPSLLATLRDHHVVRLFPSALNSELGTEIEIEISGAAPAGVGLPVYSLLLRNVASRVSPYRDPKLSDGFIESVAEPVGKMPLRQLIRSAVEAVERHYVHAALGQTGGNRTAAADLLGLSRQSLYVKMAQYGFEDEPLARSE